MKELPNPLQSLNSIGDGLTTKIAGKLTKKLSGIQKLNKFPKLFPLKKLKSKKKNSKIKELKKTVSELPSISENEKSKSNKSSPIQVYIARDLDEIKEAQRLRYQVFAEEMGATLTHHEEGLDVDEFDTYCDHLIVRDTETLQVVGTYRILPPEQAKQIGRLYSESEFDLTRLQHLFPNAVEVGRSCVHQNYRSGGVIMALWAGLGSYMKQHGYEIMLGCASVPMGDGGHYAASLHRVFSEKSLSPLEYRTFPKLPLPLDKLNSDLEVEPPPLIKGYLRIGAKICGEPAWDPDFNTADFLTMLRLSDINPRYAKHFLTNH
ncbi:ornithine-acyl[acyl carrier protein] N-acyltransferase [Polynucleobacter kasalickyi]|uniref:L-ornithine N(alpha)-acyltransferase n=1 Tax=Polynucleobacter kasalickyi TaxID=1938817 RepID=A0A1W1ZW96_9BURK|nr:GNAT family N-acyltransferase [Polynucleobacter kasalickyi]SMC52626.1 ornithine-acyl[acyl carrier protein] N-acyltransferase [Polynucleobacter kasalickyi]